jgi:hypothetical protein
MKKLILSSVAFLGLFGAFVAPAQAQILVNSTPSGGSITGAASFTNFNGSTSAIAGEVTFPANRYAVDVRVVPQALLSGTAAGGDVILGPLRVLSTTAIATIDPTTGTSVESAVAAAITGVPTTGATTPNLNTQVSLIRAWTSGGLN